MMCPPSTRNHVDSNRSRDILFFDKNRRSLHQNHKFATADLSQVCDGRNWESFHHATESSKRKQYTAVRKTASISDVRDKMKSIVLNGNAAADKAAADKMKSDIIQSYNPKSSRTSVPCISDCFVEQKQQKIKKRTSLGSTEEVSSDTDKVAAREQSKPQDQGSPSVQPISNYTNIYRRHSSSFSRPSRQHSDEGNEDRRRNSSACRRRHSNNEEKVPHIKLPRRGKQSQRRSLDSSTCTGPTLSGKGSLKTIRKLSEPMHRCNTTNQNVSGIMRRARYSSNSLSAMATEAAPSPLRKLSSAEGEKTLQGAASTLRRNAPSLDLSRNTGAGLSSRLSLVPQRSASAVDVHLASSKMTGTNDSKMKKGMDSAHWVASGVEFSKSMEVFLFKT